MCVCVWSDGGQGARELFEWAEAKGVPLLVFSAGLGDVVCEVLQKHGVRLGEQVHVISNFMECDERGIVVGFRPPMVHVFNKNEHSLRGTPYYEKIRERRNVLLLGDSLGDLGMSRGIDHHVVLALGLYNADPAQDPTAFAEYRRQFDVLLLRDSPLAFPLSLLHQIAAAVPPASSVGH